MYYFLLFTCYSEDASRINICGQMSMLLIVLYIETGWYHLTSKIPQIRIIIYGIHYRLKEKWKEKKKTIKECTQIKRLV